ncbi:PLDc N-terminal domain-containing protein [Cellulomonas sp.]|uniref:PLDc N-terminal domain-containing protein n=1 Tax=Cellulomonas sp. TaxID=40001 RepID=UPI001B02BC21|nr:PLDc N-terminal domain-containing protein [Cellulomonas sp.]MBO9555408.1 PLDc N-terminal domain-containing protein [Cellulomonas sp.]
MRNVGVLIVVGLLIYCLIDIARSSDDERLGAPRVLWALLVLLVPLFGSIAWLAISRLRRPATDGGTSRAPGGRPVVRRRQGPVAPDDDPDFLRKLDQERRRRENGSSDEESPQV